MCSLAAGARLVVGKKLHTKHAYLSTHLSPRRVRSVSFETCHVIKFQILYMLYRNRF
jgi:hypothetical protein